MNAKFSIQYFRLVKWFHSNQNATSIKAKSSASNPRIYNHKLDRRFVRSCDQRKNFFTNRIVPFWNARLKDNKSIQ